MNKFNKKSTEQGTITKLQQKDWSSRLTSKLPQKDWLSRLTLQKPIVSKSREGKKTELEG
jgi:hypothetical protein